VSENRAQDIANKIFPGLGIFLAILIAFGGLIFNIGNIAGCGLGINVLTGIDPEIWRHHKLCDRTGDLLV
jgi:Mn2+/Fe2+ NRAMP family transporter